MRFYCRKSSSSWGATRPSLFIVGLDFSGFDAGFYLFGEGNYWKLLVVTACIILGLYFQDLYTALRITSRILLVQQVCLAVSCALLFIALLGYASADLILGRWMMVLGSLLVIVLVPTWRWFFWKYIIGALRSERVLLLGNSSILGEVIARIFEKPEFGYSILGYLCEDEPRDFPVPCLGSLTEVRRICSEYKPTRVVVGMAERRNRLPVQDLLEIRFGGIMIEDAADTYEVAMLRVCSPQDPAVSANLFFHARPAAACGYHSEFLFAVVRIRWDDHHDAADASHGAHCEVLSSPGPVLYRQRRVGHNGQVFTLYKFRSMYIDAEARTGAVWASKDDPRITPVGKWLRRLRLDELPQFWNVLRGDMSIVGPRPGGRRFAELLAHQIPYYRQRLAVKPGITGWAQINHKYGDTELDASIKLEYDLYYIKHVGLALDLYIIFHTVKVMLLSRGAQ